MIAIFLSLVEGEDNQEKFKNLYYKYVKLVYWIAEKRVKSHFLAEECVQETFMYLAKNFHKVGEVESPATKRYVATIAEGMAINAYNKEHRGVVDDRACEKIDNIGEEDEQLSFERFDAAELSAIIDKALSDDEKTRIFLRYVYGYKINEISRILGESYYETRKHLSHAMSKIKQHIEGEN